MKHTNMSNPFIAYADPLPNQVAADPNHNITAHIAICTRDEFSLYP
jgi:hypothetical protein